MDSSTDLFGAPVLPASLRGLPTDWLKQALAAAMDERKKALKEIVAEPGTQLAVLDALAVQVNQRTAAYQRARSEPGFDPAACLFGWRNRQSADERRATEQLDAWQVRLADVPLPPGGFEPEPAAIPIVTTAPASP